MDNSKEEKVEVVVLMTFTVGKKRYPLWTHQLMTKDQAEKAIKEGKVKYA